MNTMKEQNFGLPENLKGKVAPEVYQDSVLHIQTIVDLKHMGKKAPSWEEWVREYSLKDAPANKLPDPLEQTDPLPPSGIIYDGEK